MQAVSPALTSPLLVIAPAFSAGCVHAIVRLRVQCPPGPEIALITSDDLLWLAETNANPPYAYYA